MAASSYNSDYRRDSKKSWEELFALAVKLGFQGSIYDWLESLTKEKFIIGKSAYEIAVEYGYQGTEREWLDTIQRDEVEEDAIGAIDGVNRIFKTSSPYSEPTIKCYLNSLREYDFVKIDDTTIEMNDPPLCTGFVDSLKVVYIKK